MEHFILILLPEIKYLILSFLPIHYLIENIFNNCKEENETNTNVLMNYLLNWNYFFTIVEKIDKILKNKKLELNVMDCNLEDEIYLQKLITKNKLETFQHLQRISKIIVRNNYLLFLNEQNNNNCKHLQQIFISLNISSLEICWIFNKTELIDKNNKKLLQKINYGQNIYKIVTYLLLQNETFVNNLNYNNENLEVHGILYIKQNKIQFDTLQITNIALKPFNYSQRLGTTFDFQILQFKCPKMLYDLNRLPQHIKVSDLSLMCKNIVNKPQKKNSFYLKCVFIIVVDEVFFKYSSTIPKLTAISQLKNKGLLKGNKNLFINAQQQQLRTFSSSLICLDQINKLEQIKEENDLNVKLNERKLTDLERLVLKMTLTSKFGIQNRFLKLSLPSTIFENLQNLQNLKDKNLIIELMKMSFKNVQLQNPLLQSTITKRDNEDLLNSKEFYFEIFKNLNEIPFIEMSSLNTDLLINKNENINKEDNQDYNKEYNNNIENGIENVTESMNYLFQYFINTFGNENYKLGDPLFKVFYTIVPERNELNLVLQYHHSIGDGLTLNRLIDQFLNEYSNLLNNYCNGQFDNLLNNNDYKNGIKERRIYLSTSANEKLQQLNNNENNNFLSKFKEIITFCKDVYYIIKNSKNLNLSLLKKEHLLKPNVPMDERKITGFGFDLHENVILKLKEIAKENQLTLNPFLISIFNHVYWRIVKEKELQNKNEDIIYLCGEYTFNSGTSTVKSSTTTLNNENIKNDSNNKKGEEEEEMVLGASTLNYFTNFNNQQVLNQLMNLNNTIDSSSNNANKEWIYSIINNAKEIKDNHQTNMERSKRMFRFIPMSMIEKLSQSNIENGKIHFKGGNIIHLVTTNTGIANIKREYKISEGKYINVLDMKFMANPILFGSCIGVGVSTLPKGSKSENSSVMSIQIAVVEPIIGKEVGEKFTKYCIEIISQFIHQYEALKKL
ncbi:hypothetical protein ABK040_011856 [Willaertia magna]